MLSSNVSGLQNENNIEHSSHQPIHAPANACLNMATAGWLYWLSWVFVLAKNWSGSRQVMGGRVCGCQYNSGKANPFLGRDLSASGHQPQALRLWVSDLSTGRPGGLGVT